MFPLHLQVSNRTLRAMLANDRCAAAEVAGELEEMRGRCEDAADLDSASFLRILQVSKGLLA